MSTSRVAIFGGPGTGAVAAQSVSALAASGESIELFGFLNDVLPRGERCCGAPVVGAFASWRELPDDVCFLAPLHKAKEMPARIRLINSLEIPERRWATIIDPRSAIAPDAGIGAGCFIGPFATVGPGTRLGRHNVARAGAHISHDCTLGDFVFVGTGAVVCGLTAAGEGAYIAPNATIRERCRIGRHAVVGLGSVVVGDVPDFAVVAGSPARNMDAGLNGDSSSDDVSD